MTPSTFLAAYSGFNATSAALTDSTIAQLKPLMLKPWHDTGRWAKQARDLITIAWHAQRTAQSMVGVSSESRKATEGDLSDALDYLRGHADELRANVQALHDRLAHAFHRQLIAEILLALQRAIRALTTITELK